jgi:nicotinate phosphoribosyltransferase
MALTDQTKPTDVALNTDLYELTMAQGFWESGLTESEGCFNVFFRDNPFGSGYAVACGMGQIADLVENFRFDDEAIAYLASIQAPGGGAMFKQGFLDYLRDFRMHVSVSAIPEGELVFPREPMVRVIGPVIDCQLLETALLNLVNFQTLVATKTARVVHAAEGHPVSDFGLRRAQGPDGGLAVARASYIGGATNTSNVLAGRIYGIPVFGTHAHSWVMAFPSEVEAFRAFAASSPKNCVFLLDTYDVHQGIKNAITVAKEMEERGERLAAIRIDSGDLAWQAKMARKMLDEGGLPNTGIVLSNDLDEYTVKSIRDAGAPVTSWGIGTKLATAYDQPALGGVYKLSAKQDADGQWQDCIKVTGNLNKLTTPGVLDVRRYFHPNGKIAGDMVFDVNRGVTSETIIDPADELRRKDLAGKEYIVLLEPLARDGEVVLAPESRSAMAARTRCAEQLELLDESQKRILNPHSYPVGLEKSLFKRRRDLVAHLRGIE